MRKFVLMAAVAAAVGSPAYARDHSGYVGLDIGALIPTGTSVNGKLTDETADQSMSASNIATIHYKGGYDADLVGGYDFGMFRLEGEAGIKHASLDKLHFPDSTVNTVYDLTGVDIPSDVALDGNVRSLSGMVNGLVDFSGSALSGYAGAGVGLADVRYSGGGFSASDTRFAWQLLAGVYVPVSGQLDLGIKYRYFRTGKLKFSGSDTVDGDLVKGELSGHFASHSLMASLVYSFRAPASPLPSASLVAPPAPPPPIVQTCPDGSTMPTTSVCPTVPQPAARPERG